MRHSRCRSRDPPGPTGAGASAQREPRGPGSQDLRRRASSRARRVRAVAVGRAGGRLRAPPARDHRPDRAGAQPMVDAGSGCAITFNGEIYNFGSLRRELEALGESFVSTSDTEVILKAYKRWGLDAVGRLPRHLRPRDLGSPRPLPSTWSATRWASSRSTGRRVRDRDTGEEVVLFASEVRALLASGAVPRRLDPAAVASYLWHGFVVGPGTIVADVRAAPRRDRADDRAGRAGRSAKRAERCASTGSCRRRRAARARSTTCATSSSTP